MSGEQQILPLSGIRYPVAIKANCPTEMALQVLMLALVQWVDVAVEISASTR
jgi:hypothetical protein